jgi:hypothetical protein
MYIISYEIKTLFQIINFLLGLGRVERNLLVVFSERGGIEKTSKRILISL